MSCRCVIYTDIYFKSNGKKYKTIKALNHAWATQRWSRKLSSFEDVAMQVNEYEIGAPEAWLDMRRFFSDGIADFITELAETVEQMRRERLIHRTILQNMRRLDLII